MKQSPKDPLSGRVGISQTRLLCAAALAIGIAIFVCQEASAASVSPPSIAFQAVQGSASPSSQTVILNKGNNSPASWTATDSAGWLSLSPGSGTIKRTTQITLSVNVAGLTAGTYTTTVSVDLSRGGRVLLPVTLTIRPATTTRPPTNMTTTTTTLLPTNTSTTTNTSSGTTTATTNTSSTTNRSAIVSWDIGTESDLVGYKVYVGTASGIYYYPGSPFAVGKVNTYTVSNLPIGQTYFFAVSAIDTAGNASTLSAEVSKSIY